MKTTYSLQIEQIQPKSKLTENIISVSLSLALFFQGIILLAWSSFSLYQEIQILIAVSIFSIVIHALWKNRFLLPHRIDMNIVMFTFGGLGMIIGSWIDNGFSVPMHLCHMHHLGNSWLMLFKVLLTWHILLMILLPLPYTLLYTRCALIAKTSFLQFLNTYILGTIGMVIGMFVLDWISMKITIPNAYRMIFSHTSMLIGMIIGMNLFTFLLDYIYGDEYKI